MKSKLVYTLLLAGALSASAQGFKDGVEYYRADQPEEAKIILTNNLGATSGTDLATAYYYLGQIALQSGDKAGAKANFDKGIATDAQNGYNYVGLGALDLANGDASAASGHFKEAKKLAKKNADILTEIARAYFIADPVKYNNEIEKGLADAKKAFKNAPAPFILEGDRLAKTNIGDAVGFYEMAANFDTNLEHPEAYVKYARVYFPVAPDYAINKLKDLLAAQPNSALAQRELAEKYYDNNQLTMAADQYEKYIQNPNSFKRDKQRLVGLLFFAKRYNDSYDLASQILAEEPDNHYMQRLQFYNKKALEEKDAAKAAAEKLFANPTAQLNSQDYIQYAELLQDMGSDTLAVEMYEKAVAVSPEKTSLLKDLSAAYSSAKMYDKAADTMAKYIDSEGENADPNDMLSLANRYKNLAIANLDTDSVASAAAAAKALQTIDKVIARISDNPMVLNTKSDILRIAARGAVTPDVVAADETTLAVLDADPSNATNERRIPIYRAVLGRLGNYYLTTAKDVEKAKVYFQKFYEVSPSDDLKAFIDGLDANAK